MSTKNVKKDDKKKTINATDKIEFKNYVYAALILILGILLVLYIFEWINVKNTEKLMTSYLVTSNTVTSTITDTDSLEQILLETASSYFIYFGYTDNEDVYDLEVELKSIIDDYNLNEVFYYFDLTDMMDKEEDYISIINEVLGIDYLEKVPAIIYVHEGVIEESNVLDGVGDTLLKASDLSQLLDIYEYEEVN